VQKKLLLFLTALLIWGIGIVPVAPVAHVNATGGPADDEFELLRVKWINYLVGSDYNTEDPDILDALSRIDNNVTNLEGTGAWDTMEQSQGRTVLWQDLPGSGDAVHAWAAYNRLKNMTIAWSTIGSEWYGNEDLKEDIINGLDWLYVNRYNENKLESGNWWEWEIGIPQSLGDIMVLLHEHLTPVQIENYSNAINKFCPDPTKRTGNTPNSTANLVETGANRLDKALAVVLLGINTGNSAKIEQGRDAIGHVLSYVTSGDGFYEDGSFVFHSSIAYTGSYGGVLIGDIAKLLTLLDESSWPVTDPNMNNVFRWVTDSYEPLIYRGRMMDMVYGRAVSRIDEHKRGWLVPILRLADFASPELQAQFKSFVKGQIVADPLLANAYEGRRLSDITLLKVLMNDDTILAREDLVMHKQLSAMDRVVHFRPGYAFGLSMSSTRIANYETGINQTENPRGWYTGDGMTYLYNRDMMYMDNFWPTVNAYRLPGTTSDGATRSPNKKPSTSWVGGSSIDSLYGVAGMDLDPDNSTLSGKKSWFMFNDEIVALGAGLTSTDNREVETIVENRILTSEGDNKLVVNGEMPSQNLGWSESMNNVKWAYLEGKDETTGVGYYFPNKAVVEGLREVRTGAWRNIHPSGPSDLITRNYLSLAINHGVNPVNKSYAYVLLPGKSAADTAQYSTQPDILTLSNTAQVQAVKELSLGTTGANFWEAGTVDFIKAGKPMSVMTMEQDDVLKIAVSDPTQRQTKVTLELAKSYLEVIKKDPSIKVLRTFPTILLEVNTAGALGKSHNIAFRINPDIELDFLDETLLEPDTAAKLKVSVVEDTYVQGPNGGYGSARFLNIRNGTGTTDRKAFVKYDLTDVEGEIERADLHVYGETNDGNGRITLSNIAVYGVLNDQWQENTLTFNNMPETAPERLDVQVLSHPMHWQQFNVTAFVQEKLKSNKMVSLSLRQVESNAHAGIVAKGNTTGNHSYLELLLKDTLAPVTTATIENEQASGIYDHDITVHFVADDHAKGWGVFKTEYRINGEKWKPVKDGKLLLQDEGTYTISYRSTDKAGNVEAAQQFVLSIARPTANSFE